MGDRTNSSSSVHHRDCEVAMPGGNYPVDWEETVRAYMESEGVRACAKRLGVPVGVALSRITRLRSAGVDIPHKTARGRMGGQHARPIPVEALNKIVAQYEQRT